MGLGNFCLAPMLDGGIVMRKTPILFLVLILLLGACTPSGKEAEISKIEVINLKNGRSNNIVATDFDVINEEYCRLVYYSNGKKIKEYILNIKNVSYSYEKDQLTVALNDAEPFDHDCLSYEESLKIFNCPSVKIQLSGNEKLIMSSK